MKEIEFPDGSVYRIGTVPICSNEKFEKLTGKPPEYFEISEQDTAEKLDDVCLRIVRLFNKNIDEGRFFVNTKAYSDIMQAWLGIEPAKKKETLKVSEDTPEPSQSQNSE